MRKRLLVTVPVIALLSWLGWRWAAPPGNPSPLPSPASASEPLPPDPAAADREAVFKKAFWRAPSAGDEILHAERREWSDEEGVTKWQWFIAVKTSPELLSYLRDENAFGLIPAETAEIPDDSPAWFAFGPGEVQVLKSPRGRMQLVFNPTENTLHASDAGGGLQRGAPEPASSTPTEPQRATPVPGRLPNSPPPTSPS
jgi:hypothetical protein